MLLRLRSNEEFGGGWHRLIGIQDLLSYSRLYAFSDCPQEGPYLIQPRLMRVDYPAHLDDITITKGTYELREASVSVPTPMSFFNCRIKLAELCRETVDL